MTYRDRFGRPEIIAGDWVAKGEARYRFPEGDAGDVHEGTATPDRASRIQNRRERRERLIAADPRLAEMFPDRDSAGTDGAAGTGGAGDAQPGEQD